MTGFRQRDDGPTDGSARETSDDPGRDCTHDAFVATLAGDSPADAAAVDARGVDTHDAEPLGHLERGATLGRYVILEQVGRGGMSIVYAAYDPELDRKVAIKVLLPGRRDKTAARARLQREAQAIASVTHPHVIAVHDVGVEGGRVFLAMEFVQGRDLAAWAKTRRSVAETLRVYLHLGRPLEDLFDGLSHGTGAHAGRVTPREAHKSGVRGFRLRHDASGVDDDRGGPPHAETKLERARVDPRGRGSVQPNDRRQGCRRPEGTVHHAVQPDGGVSR